MKRDPGKYVVNVDDDGEETWTMMSIDETSIDHGMIQDLIHGRIKKVGKKTVCEFLRGQEERLALKMFANLLRAHAKLDFKFNLCIAQLAVLLDPDEGIHRRRLVFDGGNIRSVRAAAIADDLALADFKKIAKTTAVADAMHKFGVSQKTVERAYKPRKEDAIRRRQTIEEFAGTHLQYFLDRVAVAIEECCHALEGSAKPLSEKLVCSIFLDQLVNQYSLPPRADATPLEDLKRELVERSEPERQEPNIPQPLEPLQWREIFRTKIAPDYSDAPKTLVIFWNRKALTLTDKKSTDSDG
jgi:hypothetical protein